MVSKEQALGEERYFHFSECRLSVGPRGGVKTNITSYRRNGKTKLWKKQPERFQFPVKTGFYGPSAYITDKSAHLWHAESECPVMQQLREKPFVAAEQKFSEGFQETIPRGNEE